MIKFGSTPQRAHAPWFTNVQHITRALVLPDVVTGPRSILPTSSNLDYRSLEGSPEEFGLLDGISPQFRAGDTAYWHVHVDLALNRKRGDAAGIAMGREIGSWVESGEDGLGVSYQRIVRSYEVPFVAQIRALSGDQIYLNSITRLILQLKQLRGFNITSFSFDGFQSAGSMQELALAGLVTAGMRIEEDGAVTGMPKPFSVDGRSAQPYTELLESANEGRVKLPRYELLRKELRELEVIAPGAAPDHPLGGSKDVADPVAGVVGYLAAFGHAVLHHPLEGAVFDREDLGLERVPNTLGVEGDNYLGVAAEDDDSLSWDHTPLSAAYLGVEE
jgi:hypothetical protein